MDRFFEKFGRLFSKDRYGNVVVGKNKVEVPDGQLTNTTLGERLN